MIEKSFLYIRSKSKLQYVALLLSGVICAFGQPDRHFIFPLIAYLFGYSSAIVLFLECRSRKERFILSFLWASGIELFQLNWLANTHYHGMGILFVYLFLSFGIALQFALLFLILPVQKEVGVRFALLVAAVWCIIEWSRLYYLCGFPFNSLGLVLTFSPILMQLASLFGIYGLSFWVMLSSVLGAIAWKAPSKKNRMLWLGALLAPPFFGVLHIEIQKNQRVSSPIMDVALIQTGLTSEQKWEFPGRKEEAIQLNDQWTRIFAQLGKSGFEKFDLIVLPEVALPGEAYEASVPYRVAVNELIGKRERLPPLAAPLADRNDEGEWFVSNAWISQALANHYQSEVIIGLLDYDEALDETYNSAFHFTPFQNRSSRYNKRVLVPLAEYIPISIMKSFMERFGIFGFFTPGKKADVFLGAVPIATSICYEEGYNYLMREGRLEGARMFVNISNDGWFPHSRLPIEHFNLGRLRAVENGVPVLRACNTGVTAIINSYGETLASLGEMDEKGNQLSGLVAKKITCNTHRTIFSLFGNAFILSISMIVISLCVAINVKFG
jgi:apolipoprotein N-acyltransferase